MERFFQYFFDGLSLGSIYALLALGLVVVFRGTGHLNFAQGEMAMICTFVVWQFNDWGIPLVLSIILGMIVGFALGAEWRPPSSVASPRNPRPVCSSFRSRCSSV